MVIFTLTMSVVKRQQLETIYVFHGTDSNVKNIKNIIFDPLQVKIKIS